MLLSDQILPKKEGKLQKKKNEQEIVLVKSTHVIKIAKMVSSGFCKTVLKVNVPWKYDGKESGGKNGSNLSSH